MAEGGTEDVVARKWGGCGGGGEEVVADAVVVSVGNREADENVER